MEKQLRNLPHMTNLPHPNNLPHLKYLTYSFALYPGRSVSELSVLSAASCVIEPRTVLSAVLLRFDDRFDGNPIRDSVSALIRQTWKKCAMTHNNLKGRSMCRTKSWLIGHPLLIVGSVELYWALGTV